MVASHVRRQASDCTGKLIQPLSGRAWGPGRGEQLVYLRIHLLEFPPVQLWQFRNDFLRTHTVKNVALFGAGQFDCGRIKLQPSIDW